MSDIYNFIHNLYDSTSPKETDILSTKMLLVKLNQALFHAKSVRAFNEYWYLTIQGIPKEVQSLVTALAAHNTAKLPRPTLQKIIKKVRIPVL